MITIRDEEKGDLKVKIKAVCENYMDLPYDIRRCV